ncbi:hypothetical protein PLANPX_3860 [Lacipirellula parvula]|uniref:Uncharacterized protein n=1 Tax=Lacipirellula parvula TaxID=2650471 RepID=A0A5K7XCQ7_9BACT|nr:hypothetical protein PLANPX_3860 [Lacipirellula parvula]
MACNHVGLLCNWSPGEPGYPSLGLPTTCIVLLDWKSVANAMPN